VLFRSEQPARKKFLQEIALAVVEKATRNPLLPRSFFDALGRAASERRVAVWSSLPAEQKILEQTSLGHAIPDDSAPYAAVVVNNLAGNKMDYYLKREIEYAADGCDGSTRYSTITVRLANTATPDLQLPDFYAGTAGLDRDISVGRVPLEVPTGTMVTSIRVLATKGATLKSVTSNGERTSAFTSTERGHPSFEVQVAIPPGTSGDVTFRLIEPTSSGSPRVPIQPLIDSVVPKIDVPTCPE